MENKLNRISKPTHESSDGDLHKRQQVDQLHGGPLISSGIPGSAPLFYLDRSKLIITGGTFVQNTIQSKDEPLRILREKTAANAFHDAEARFDPPKCHPHTRVAVLKKIKGWILGEDEETRDKSTMWLFGSAGSGKSSIAQTIVEECIREGLVLASFFFGKIDSTRNHTKSLVATLAYQIYTSIPDIRSRIVAPIENDTLILERSLDHQFTSLITKPLQEYFATSSLPSVPRHLIVIDGLDECNDVDSRQRLLRILSTTMQQCTFPVVFLVASRPEQDIMAVFNSKSMKGLHARLPLDLDYHRDNDIRLFLTNKFEDIRENHPFADLIPPTWPTERTISELVYKSSGQFIYPATVVKFIETLNDRPDDRLKVVLNLRPPKRKDLPFSELDSLYTHIIYSAKDINMVLEVFAYILLCDKIVDANGIEDTMSLRERELDILFSNLRSLVELNAGGVTILHASLYDFFVDPLRSKDLFIDLDHYRTKHLINSFRAFARPTGPKTASPIAFSAKELVRSPLSHELQDAIKQVSLERIITVARAQVVFFGGSSPELVFHDFVPAFFRALRRLEQDSAEQIERQTHELDSVMASFVESYYNNELNCLQLALLSLGGTHELLPIVSETTSILGRYNLAQPRPPGRWYHDPLSILNAERVQFLNEEPYYKYISDFIHDPGRSKQHTIGTRLYTKSAIACLEILSPHYYDLKSRHRIASSLDNSVLPVVTYEDEVDAVDDLEPKEYDYDTHPQFYLLGSLIYFLRRASRHEFLIELCQVSNFHQREDLKERFPYRFSRAIHEIEGYLSRMGIS